MLFGLVLFVIGIVFMGDIQFQRRYRIHINFDNVEGLPNKGAVKIAGVDVGKIEEIMLVQRGAMVTIRLNRNVVIHKDAKARIAATGLIGSKYLELTQGTEATPILKSGGTIQGMSSMSFNDLMNKLSELFKEGPEGESVGRNLRMTMVHLRRVSEVLDHALAEQETKLVGIVDNLHKITLHVREAARHIDEIVSTREEDMKVTFAKMRSISEKLDTILTRIEAGEGTIGKLVSDKEMGEDLKETMASIKGVANDAKSVLGRIAMIETYWDYRQRYDVQDEKFRTDVGLRIQPRPGKFYFVSVNNLGSKENAALPGSDFEERNTITGVMGQEFGPVTIYAGVIRSAGGAGVAFRPFWRSENWKRRFELQAAAFDFARDEIRQGRRLESPVYNAGARLGLTHWAWIGGQVEDISERAHFNANINLTFKDEDIAYLLGLVGLAR